MATRRREPAERRNGRSPRTAFALAAVLGWLASCAFVPLPRFGGGGDAARGTPSAYGRAAPHGAPVRRSLLVPMRDGVRLAVDLILPGGLAPGERVPALLHQGRYWRSVSLRGPAWLLFDRVARHGQLGPFKDRFVRRGYAWLDVDTRGSGASFGTRLWDFSPEEIQDGADLVDWIVRQPWSNGRVAGVGVSYSGSAAELLLANRRPAVKAALPLFCDFDQYQDILAPGGVPHRAWLETWGDFTRRLDRGVLPIDAWWMRLFVRGVRPVDGDHGRALLAAALRDHGSNFDFAALGEVVYRDDLPFDGARAAGASAANVARADAWLADRFGPEFRARGTDLASPHAYAADVDASGAPVYAYSGWLDGAYAGAAVARFAKLRNPGNRLLIGPWDHSLHVVSPYGALGPSRFDHTGELLRFLDAHVQGLATGIEGEPRVHYYTEGAETWRAADSWPPPAEPLLLYLAPGGALGSAPPTEDAAADAYAVDFDAGTGPASRWSALSGRPIGAPYPDRAARDRRLLVYMSAPLAAAVEVTGQPIVTLHVASSASDGAFFAYLEDVAPDGRVLYVTEGLLRGLHRRRARGSCDPLALPERSFRRADAEALVPGQVAELAFPLLPTSTVFAAGHRVRLALAGADADHFGRIPATGPVTWQVQRSRAYPSRVALPATVARAR